MCIKLIIASLKLIFKSSTIKLGHVAKETRTTPPLGGLIASGSFGFYWQDKLHSTELTIL